MAKAPRTSKPKSSRKSKTVKTVKVIKANKKTGNMPEYASLSETVDLPVLTVGNYYNINDVQLAQFARASAIAQGYQQFRIRRLTFKYQPLLDTFSSVGNTQVPYLYWIINRVGNDFPGATKAWFISQGAKPLRLDDKVITLSYKPAVMYDNLEASVPAGNQQPNAPKTMQWLTTNKDAFIAGLFAPSQVSHVGHFFAAFSEGSAVPITYRCTMTAEIEFKQPLAKVPSPGDPGYILKTPLTIPVHNVNNSEMTV